MPRYSGVLAFICLVSICVGINIIRYPAVAEMLVGEQLPAKNDSSDCEEKTKNSVLRDTDSVSSYRSYSLNESDKKNNSYGNKPISSYGDYSNSRSDNSYDKDSGSTGSSKYFSNYSSGSDSGSSSGKSSTGSSNSSGNSSSSAYGGYSSGSSYDKDSDSTGSSKYFSNYSSGNDSGSSSGKNSTGSSNSSGSSSSSAYGGYGSGNSYDKDSGSTGSSKYFSNYSSGNDSGSSSGGSSTGSSNSFGSSSSSAYGGYDSDNSYKKDSDLYDKDSGTDKKSDEVSQNTPYQSGEINPGYASSYSSTPESSTAGLTTTMSRNSNDMLSAAERFEQQKQQPFTITNRASRESLPTATYYIPPSFSTEGSSLAVPALPPKSTTSFEPLPLPPNNQ